MKVLTGFIPFKYYIINTLSDDQNAKVIFNNIDIFSLALSYAQHKLVVGDEIWGLTTQMSSDNQYLKVTKVVSGSLANISGLRRGDRIFQIDRKKVSDMVDPIRKFLQKYSGKYLSLKITRLSKSIDIEVPVIYNVKSHNDYLTEGTLYGKVRSGYDEVPEWVVGNIELTLLNDNTKDFLKYKTYDFEYTSSEEPLLEKKVFEELGNQLNELGLSRSVENPDLLDIANYFSGNREKYTPPQQIISTRIVKSYNWYWGNISVSNYRD